MTLAFQAWAACLRANLYIPTIAEHAGFCACFYIGMSAACIVSGWRGGETLNSGIRAWSCTAPMKRVSRERARICDVSFVLGRPRTKGKFHSIGVTHARCSRRPCGPPRRCSPTKPGKPPKPKA